jgi:hypothetical protein
MFFGYTLLVAPDKNFPQHQMFVEAGNIFANSGQEAEEKILKEANTRYKEMNHLTFTARLFQIENSLIIRAYNEISGEQHIILRETKSVVDQLILYPALNPRKTFVYKTIKITLVDNEYIVEHGKKTYQSNDPSRIRSLIEDIMGVEHA